MAQIDVEIHHISITILSRLPKSIIIDRPVGACLPITAKGKEAPDVAWSDPLQALYLYPLEYRSRRKAERLYRPGSLPRAAKARARSK